MGGVSFAVSRGMESATNEPTMSYAAKTSIMGATVAAGVSQIDVKSGTDKDPSFVTVGYSIAGLNLGYAVYDSDENGDETSIDFKQMMDIVKKAGYKGYVGIEYEGNKLSEDEGIVATKKLLEKLI